MWKKEGKRDSKSQARAVWVYRRNEAKDRKIKFFTSIQLMTLYYALTKKTRGKNSEEKKVNQVFFFFSPRTTANKSMTNFRSLFSLLTDRWLAFLSS